LIVATAGIAARRDHSRHPIVILDCAPIDVD